MFKELLCALYVVSYSLNILYIVIMSWTEDGVKKLKDEGYKALSLMEFPGH